jgi:HlyD family secretion protein
MRLSGSVIQAHRAKFVRPVITIALLYFTACKAKPEVPVVTVGRGSVEATVTGVNSGTVKAEQIAELAFGAVGRVSEVNVHLGQAVRSGEILAEVENGDLRSRLSVAAEELDRAKRLSQSQAASRSNVIQAQGTYDTAVTAYERSLIRAPFDGIVAEQNLEVGQLSQITAVIPLAPIRLVDIKPRYVRVEIDEVDLPKVQVGLPARIKVLAVRREPFKATVRKVVPYVSTIREQDRTSEIELTVDSEGVLLPAGASADVDVVTATKNNVLTVVSKAVLGRGQDRYVYRLVGGRLVKTLITTGISGYNLTEILSGLSEGDRVVLPSEKAELKDGLAVVAKPS